MSACVLFMREMTLNRSELEPYWARGRESMVGYPLKVLAAYGRHVTLEGQDVECVVIAEFPSLEACRVWQDIRCQPGTRAYDCDVQS